MFAYLLTFVTTCLLCPLISHQTSPAWRADGQQLAPQVSSLTTLLKGTFSIRCVVERYGEGNYTYKTSTKSYERYSYSQARAVVELETINSNNNKTGVEANTTTSKTNNKVAIKYYHDARTNVWLKQWHNKTSECHESSKSKFNEDLYGDDLMMSMLAYNVNEDHIVGSAKFLLLVRQLKRSVSFSKKPKITIANGIKVVSFEGELKSHNPTIKSKGKIVVFYNLRQLLLDKLSEPGDTFPLYLEFTHEPNLTNTILVIRFHEFKRLDMIDPNIEEQHHHQQQPPYLSFLFPLASGCGSVLAGLEVHHSDRESQKLLTRMASISKVSFRARMVENLKPNSGDIIENAWWLVSKKSSSSHYFFAFDLRAKLLRKDKFIGEHSAVQYRATSTTIYDFNQNKKYNLFSSSSTQTVQVQLQQEMDSSSGSKSWQQSMFKIHEEAACVTSEIGNKRRKAINYSEFISFERLQFMGKTRLNGISANVYEDDQPDRLPFWLFPTVLVKRASVDGDIIEIDEKSSRGGPVGNITLIYYFIAAEQSQHTNEIGHLLRTDIIIRDPLRNLLLMSKTVLMYDFLWGRIFNSPTGDTKTSNLFGLGPNCASGLNSKKYAHLALLLEPKTNEQDLTLHDLKLSDERLAVQVDRNEALVDVLDSEFELPRTHLDYLRSKLLRKSQRALVERNRTQQLLSKWLLPTIEIELRVSELDMERVECCLLGRGQFISHSDNLLKSEATTFEDCLWFANHNSRLLKEVIVFAYSQRRSECLLDRLHKRRELQAHEASIAGESAIESLNYLPYEYGEYVMYKVSSVQPALRSADSTKRQAGGPTSSESSWPPPILRSKALSLIGKRVTLPIYSNDAFLEIQYTLKHVKIFGELAKIEGASLASQKHVKHLGWRQSNGEQHDGLVIGIEAVNRNLMSTGVNTEKLCQSLCLLDVECKSYSFCDRSRSNQAECSLSGIDVRPVEVEKQLGVHVNELDRKKNVVKRISLQLPSTNSSNQSNSVEVTIRINRKCSIFSKSYVELFKKSHQVAIDMSKQSDAILLVSDENECARRCFEKNLDFLKGIIRHKTLDFNEIQRDLMKMAANGNGDEMSSAKLESVLDWRRRHVRTLCIHFYYFDNSTTTNHLNQSSNDVGHSTESNSCILANSSNPYIDPADMLPKQPTVVPVNHYKLIYSHLFERAYGFRLAGSEPEMRKSHENESILANYKHLLSSHQAGDNRQIMLGMDDVEYCARACTLQTHGPSPSCSSFDFVYEHTNSSGQKYCLLNSQSLHDLKRRGHLDGQVLYAENKGGVQYWHFEPRESLIMPVDNAGHSNIYDDDDDDNNISNLLNNDSLLKNLDLEHGGKPVASQAGAFTCISFIITLLGGMSGLIFGIKLARLWSDKKAKDIEDITFKHKVVRLVRRLSGESLSSRLLEGEVWM